MGKILEKLGSTVAAGVVLVILFALIVGAWHREGLHFDHGWWSFFFRWLHVLSGIMWIGLLYYLNFVQVPNMPKIPAEQRPAVSKVIAPAVLFWFRWAAMATIITGLILAWLNGYILDAIAIGIASGVPRDTAIGLGMWLGTIMWFNVWFVIWPNQKIALGIVEADDDAKAKAARKALMFSRTNTALSLPMLWFMVSAQNIF